MRIGFGGVSFLFAAMLRYDMILFGMPIGERNQFEVPEVVRER